MSTVHCTIVSAEQELYSGDVEMVICTGSIGDLGITPGHTPLLTGLRPGPVRLMLEDGEEEVFFASGGFLEVQPGQVTILSDTGVRGSDVDEMEANRAKEQAERELAEQKDDVDFALAQAQLAEALARLRTLDAMRKKRGRGTT